MSTRLHPFARLVVAAIGLLVAQTVAGLGLAAVYIAVTMARSPSQSFQQIIGALAGATETNALALTLFVYPIGLLWLGFCRAKLEKRSFVSLGLRRSRFGSNLLRGALAGLLSIAIIWAILWVTGAISVNGWSAAAKSPTVVLSLLGWLIAFAAVGFFEEFLFRGYALHNLTDWLGWKGAVLVQATIFALIHLGNVATASNEARVAALGAMPSIFLIGIFFAISYRKTGSLWFPIGFHAAWNFSLGCLFSLPVSGIKTFQLLDVQTQTQSWLSGGSFGAEGSFFLLPVLLALIWFMLQAPDHPQALLDLELVQPAPAALAPAAIMPLVVAAEIAPASDEIIEPERENRYRTKFGTDQGFDEEMLRELRQLQNQREAAEAEKQRESATQTAILEVELLKPPILDEPIIEKPVVEKPQVAEAPTMKKLDVAAPAQPVTAEPTTPVVEDNAEPVVAPVPPKKKASPKW